MKISLLIIISFLSLNSFSQPIAEESSSELLADKINQLSVKSDGDKILKLTRKVVDAFLIVSNSNEAMELIKLLFHLSDLRTDSAMGVLLANGTDAYIQKFGSEDDILQPVFSFFWYRIRKSDEGSADGVYDEVTGHIEFLDSFYNISQSYALKPTALYAKIENYLYLEREIRVLTDADRVDAINSAKILFREYGNRPKPRKNKAGFDENYGYYANGQLAELERLHIGAIAPDIDGTDLNGVQFKLSEYRGKVIMISFWGALCAPCIAAIPKERVLVNKYANKPFALIGINTDADIEKARIAVEKHDINWRSFWNGPGGWQGNIAYDWFVQGYPLYYLLDKNGKIHFKSRDYDGLEKTLELLLK